MKFISRKNVFLIIRILVGGIFIYASLYKIQNPNQFAHQIYNYKLLPLWVINPMAIILPWLQFLCGGAMILNKGSRGAGMWLILMMFVFQIALASALFRGINVSCGCFKAGGNPATWLTFGRDSLILFLLFLNQTLIYYHSKALDS